MNKKNKMAVMPERKLLLNMAIPSIFAMLSTAIYNLVDRIYIANINEASLTAVSLALPVQLLSIHIIVGLAIAVNALVARNLGRKKQHLADNYAANGLFLSITCAIIFIIFSLLFADIYMQKQTYFPEIAKLGTTYLRICTGFSLGIFVEIMLEQILQSTGRTHLSFITQTGGAVINIILDPIFIFGYLGMPAMGVAGAAYATVTGQTLAAILAIILNIRYNHDIKFKPANLKPKLTILKNIFKLGLPLVVMTSLSSILIFFLNMILKDFSNTAVSLLSIFFAIQSLIFMPIYGINDASVPIISYNYGAKNPQRILNTIKFSALFSSSISLISFFIFQIFTHEILGLFNPSAEMLEIGIPSLKILSYSFLTAGFSLSLSSVFQSVGKSVYSMAVSIFRQLLIILPLAKILSAFGNLNLIWLTIPLAEIGGMILSLIFLIRIKKQVINPLIAEQHQH